MKVNRKVGTCNSWQELDPESRQAMHLAERMVKNKRGVKIGNELHNNCMLDIHYASNIYNTQIDIINKDGLAVAFFSNGYFYDTIARNQVELF